MLLLNFLEKLKLLPMKEINIEQLLTIILPAFSEEQRN